jgi:hypothetical protein
MIHESSIAFIDVSSLHIAKANPSLHFVVLHYYKDMSRQEAHSSLSGHIYLSLPAMINSNQWH